MVVTSHYWQLLGGMRSRFIIPVIGYFIIFNDNVLYLY